MRRLFSFTVPVLVALALPGLAEASTGTVLSVTPAQHQLQLVTANDVVHKYHFSGRLNLNGVQRGTELSFRADGSRIVHAKALGTSSQFSFFGRVVSSGRSSVVLSLGGTQRLDLATTQSSAKHGRAALRAHCDSSSSTNNTAPTVVIEFSGLQPGETVLVTESTDSSGTVTISITVPPGTGSTSGSGSSGSGSGSSGSGSSGSGSTTTTTTTTTPTTDGTSFGAITAISPTSITIDATNDNGAAQTFAVQTASVTSGFLVGDTVDLTYEQDGSQFVATSVAYANSLTAGVVTSLASAGTGFDTITMTDDFSGQSETFYVPTALLTGQGALVGDDVSVSYYQATRGLTLDHLTDNGAAS